MLVEFFSSFPLFLTFPLPPLQFDLCYTNVQKVDLQIGEREELKGFSHERSSVANPKELANVTDCNWLPHG